MPIPSVPTETLLAAMTRFDQELRGTPDWAGWEKNKAHLYAIEHAQQRYPVKQIVSMATGLPVSEFSGGQAPGDANAYVTSHDLKIIELRGRTPTWVREIEVEPATPTGRMTATGYWIFASNPRMWAIDRFMRDRLPTNKDHGWSIRPSDARGFAPGQFGLVRVGNDTRTKDELFGAPRLRAGIYALCQVLSEPVPGIGGDDNGLWSPTNIPPPGQPTVQIRYLWHSPDAPLSIAALRALRPDFNRYVLDGLQARSFPIPEDDFWFIVDRLGAEAIDALETAISDGHKDAGSESEALLTNRQVEEGYDEDRTRRFRVRNAWIIALRKERDNYTCQACQFRLDLQGVFIIDCHHTHPLGGTNGARITKEKDLICLCPTCHRIAHTGKPLPLGIEEIRKARGLQ